MKDQRRLQDLRAGIIGTGFIAPVHIEALRRNGIAVTAICGAKDKAEAAAGLHGIPEVYDKSDFRGLMEHIPRYSFGFVMVGGHRANNLPGKLGRQRLKFFLLRRKRDHLVKDSFPATNLSYL